MENENLIDEINQYIDSLIPNYDNLGKESCISILKMNKLQNNTIYTMVMYSAKVLKECSILKKHKKNCKCCNIFYINMILDNDLKLIQTTDNSVYIDDIADIVKKVIVTYKTEKLITTG